jgi:hypothetical protein
MDKSENRLKSYVRFLSFLAFALACGSAVFVSAQDTPDHSETAPAPPARQQYFKTLIVEQGETSGEVTCTFCSVVVRGTVDGEATAVWGNVDVEGTVSSDVTAVAGSVRLRSGSHVGGDAAAVAGKVRRDSGATLEGDATSLWFLFVPGQRDFLTAGLPIFFAIHAFIVFLVFSILRAGRVRNIGEALVRRPFLTILAGILVNLAVVFAETYLAVQGWFDNFVSIGLPPLLILLTLPGIVAFSRLLGNKLKGDAVPVSAALLGTAVLVALSAIPVAGLALYTLIGIPAAGASLLSRFGFSAGAPGPDDTARIDPAA